jgi:hypothetical protein
VELFFSRCAEYAGKNDAVRGQGPVPNKVLSAAEQKRLDECPNCHGTSIHSFEINGVDYSKPCKHERLTVA